MKKAEFIKRYGEAAHEKRKTQTREWLKRNPVKARAGVRRWQIKNPKYGIAATARYTQIGIPRERVLVRGKGRHKWNPYKRIIAPDSQLHHQWVPGTSDYDGLALVEADRHMFGFIDVIEILECKITLFTEKEIREQGESGKAF